MVFSLLLFVMGLGEIVWGFWGDFVSHDKNPPIANRFEAGVLFLVLSFVIYLFAKRKQQRRN
jgi:hypothetical protein